MKNKEMKQKLSRIESRCHSLNEAIRSLIGDIEKDEQKELFEK